MSSQEGGSLRRTRVKYRQIESHEIEIDKENKFHERGQFGEVKKAKWNNHEVAVKYFTSADRKGGFSEELKNLSTLQNHERIVKLHGACMTADQPFIVLEFAPLSLEKVIHDKKSHFRYTSDNAINWLFQMAVGLEYIHNKNILHRDIKPSNILLFDSGKVLKLCDFGTAKTVETTLTNAVGTVRYMAPEVVKSQHYNKSCDVFSFSIVAWEILARRRPVLEGVKRDAPPMSFLYAMAKGDRPVQLPNTPLVMTEMIDICWHADAERRPSMVEVKQKLEYLCQFVELNRPLIFRRQQGQPPNQPPSQPPRQPPSQPTGQPRSPVNTARNVGPDNMARRTSPEHNRANERPRNVHFAVGEEPVGVPTAVGAGSRPSMITTTSTPSTTSAAVNSMASEMDRMQISNRNAPYQDVPEELRHRHYTESVIQDIRSDHMSPSMLRKQVSHPAQSSRPNDHTPSPSRNISQQSLSTSQQVRFNIGGMEKMDEQRDIFDKEPARPQLTSTPRVAPPSQIYQTKFPQATEGSNYYKQGLEADFQPVLPNPSSAESMEVYRQYRMVADKIVKIQSDCDNLRQERDNLDKEVEEDQQRLQSKEGVQMEYHDKLRHKDYLMGELKTLQEEYDRLTRSGATHR